MTGVALPALLSALALAAAAPGARGDFLNNFSGHSSATNQVAGGVNTGSLDGTYNFAVLDQATGGVAGNEFGAVVNPKATGSAKYDPIFDSRFVAGTGSGGLDTSARYLYLIQVVNNGTGTSPITSVSIAFGDPSMVTSWGYFGANGHLAGLNDVMGPVDSTNSFGTSGPFQTDATAQTGVNSPAVVALSSSNSVLPAQVQMSGNLLQITFGPGGLPPGDRSVLIGFTSNYAPSLYTGTNSSSDAFQLVDGTVVPAAGHAPLPAPEPSAFVLVGVGFGFVGLLYWGRNRARLSRLSATV